MRNSLARIRAVAFQLLTRNFLTEEEFQPNLKIMMKSVSAQLDKGLVYASLKGLIS